MKEKNMTYEALKDKVIAEAQITLLVSDAIDKLLVFDNKVEWSDAWKSLTKLEQFLYELLKKGKTEFIEPENDEINDGSFVRFFLHYGLNNKILFNNLEEQTSSLIGVFKISVDNLQLYKQKEEEVNNLKLEDIQVIDKYLGNLTLEQRNEIIDEVEFYLCHMAPISVYIEQELFSNFYKNNTLYSNAIKSDGISLFSKLKSSEYYDWKQSEKTFIYCLKVLMTSGIQTRLEEINGQQIGLKEMNDFFTDKLAEYGKESSTTSDVWNGLSLLRKAALLKQQYEVVRKNHVIYREINGISLQKKERLLFKDRLIEIKNEQTNYFAYFVNSLPNVLNKDATSLEEKLYNLLEEDVVNNTDRNYHILVDFILKRTGELTKSDVSFSRFYNYISELIKLVDKEDYKGVVEKNSQAYSCYVHPNENLRRIFPKKMLVNMSSAISARMVYNSWHYMPGNFISDQVDLSNRDFYFSPVIPDITKYDKYHHVGHVKLSVNNCIRSPFHITVSGKRLNALMDIRVMRMGEETYSVQDLLLTVAHTEILALIMQTLVNLVEEKSTDYSITRYTKKWYEEKFKEVEVGNNDETSSVYKH